LIQRDRASVLVFDMHNEYGFDDIASDSGLSKVKGLRRRLIPGPRAGGGLGSGDSTMRGQLRLTFSLEIAMKDIRPSGY
jgi:hypothetical protein